MHQSQLRNDSSIAISDPRVGHQIEMTCLSILYVGLFSCLIRSDYNFPVVLFIYFIWQQRKDSLTLKLMMICLVGVSALDVLFIFIELRVWVQKDESNKVWGTLKGMHQFGILCFCVMMILKIVLIVFIGRGISQSNKPQPL